MNAKEFLNAVTNSEGDVVELLLALFRETKAQYCAIGGLAVNAYVEPVVSLDLDVVVVADKSASFARQSLGLRGQNPLRELFSPYPTRGIDSNGQPPPPL